MSEASARNVVLFIAMSVDGYIADADGGGSSEGITFTDEGPEDLLARLKQQHGKDIWICGGADLAQQLMHAGMVDRYHLSIIPTLLGKGVRLFGALPEEQRLVLTQTQSYNGIVELVYEPSKVQG